jgi:hypothetical protein
MDAVNGSTDRPIGPCTSSEVAGGRVAPEAAGGPARSSIEGQRVRPTVVVVGAGVSGCACGAALATAGLRVILMNSAMDRVGLPAYGPDVIGQTGRWLEVGDVFEGLPLPLRNVWAQAATMPAGGGAVLNIDRRKISIETKRALELIPGLEFRQGFIIDVRLVAGGDDRQQGELEDAPTAPDRSVSRRTRDRRVEVETIFGEILDADAVVIAVGLSFGALADTETDVARGGRYGEPASEGLRTALEALGAEFRETSLEVGPRVSVRTAVERGWLTDSDRIGAGTRVSSEEPLLPVSLHPWPPGPDSWPAGYPPAPHWQPGLRVDRMVMTSGTTGHAEGDRLPALSPDGAETAEAYLSPGSIFADELATLSGGEAAPIATRMPLAVSAATIVGVGGSGRMCPGGEPVPVWVVGRSAGATDYAASLSSGLRTASDIARWLDWPVVEHSTSGEDGPGAGRRAHR